MKICPKCNRKYEDNSLRFCLEDGSALAAPVTRRGDPPPTEILPVPRVQPTQKSSAGPTVPSYPNFAEPRPATGETRSNPILTGGVIAIVVLLVALVGIAAFFVFRQTGGTQSAQTNNSTPGPDVKGSGASPSPGSSPESPQSNSPLKITASASSIRLAVQANTYYASNAIDGKRSTAWIEGADGPGTGEWIRFDFDREINLHRILIQPGYFKTQQIWASNNRLANITAEFSDGSSRDLNFDDRMDSQKVDIGSVRTRWVRFVIKSVHYGTDPDTPISEVAFEWEPVK